MNTFKRILLAFMAIPVVFSGCSQFDSEVSLRELSFEIGSDIVWNAEYMAYTLRLSLKEGSDGDYLFSYSIDGDALIKLLSTGGGTVESGRELSLEGSKPAIYILPGLASDKEHTLSMEFTKDGVSRSYSVKLPDTSQNGIGIRIDTDEALDFSRVILTNLMGPSVTTYNVTFYLDGELLTGIKYMSNTFEGTMDVDFARSESYTFEMPYLVAGEHILKVDVRSSRGSETTRLAFTEPQRRNTALTFAYNQYSGKLTLESAFNPLNTAFDVTVDITVKGAVTYRHKQFFGIADPETEYFTKTGEANARITPGIVATQLDGGVLKQLMDGIFAYTRTDASNAIGNGNSRTLHADITSVSLKFTVHSVGLYAGETVVTISPSSSTTFAIPYTYTGNTWNHDKGYVLRITPSFTVNGKTAASIRVL